MQFAELRLPQQSSKRNRHMRTLGKIEAVQGGEEFTSVLIGCWPARRDNSTSSGHQPRPCHAH